MDRLDRWAKHVGAVDSFMDEIGREFAQSSNRVHEAWLELAKAPTTNAALDRLVELEILLGSTIKIQRGPRPRGQTPLSPLPRRR